MRSEDPPRNRGLRNRSEDPTLAFTPKKRKTLESAQKYAQKGSYDKALLEYEKLLKADPKDSNLRLKIGDLHLKKGDKAKAISTYTEVAEMFSRTGFDAKAVAIYKQILRVEDEALDARTRLGECFQRMGLTSDALREFQDAFKLCQKKELKREAFELLRRVASLDPSNIADRLNLAGLFVREGMHDDARREFTSLLEEVRRQTNADQVVRVAEQMLHAFPDSAEALGALVGAKLATGQHAEAIKLLKPVVAKNPDDIQLRESLVTAYEAAGDETAARRVWREIAELYKRRGDLEKSRDILQRYVTAEALTSSSDETTAPSLILTESTGRVADDVIELDEPEPAPPAAPPKPAAPARTAQLVEKGRATPPPDRGPVSQPVRAKPAAPPPPQTAADLLTEARVSLEFGDRQEALRIATLVLEQEPDNAVARELFVQSGGRLGPEPAAEADENEKLSDLIEVHSFGESGELTSPPVESPELELDGPAPEIAALSAGEDFDTLPDVEIVLEDEEDRDEHFASVEPPIELALQPGAPAKQPAVARPAKAPAPKPPVAKPAPRPVAAAAAPAPKPPVEESPDLDPDLDIDIEVDDSLLAESESNALEFSKPIAAELEFAKDITGGGDSAADVSAQVAENLSEADFYLEQGLTDEAARIYQSVLELAPQHPKALLRLGEIEARRGKAPSVTEADIAGSAFGDTMVCEPGRAEVSAELDVSAELVEAAAVELSVIGEDTIPPIETLEPAAPDEIVIAEDSAAPLELEPADAANADDHELDETSESSDEDGDFDLASMLDEDDAHTSQTIGTLIGVGSVGRGFAEVFSAFKKGIEEQVDQGDADTHYDLAIAYKEMGLHEDAVRELETVLKTGARTVETLSLLAHCKLALGDPTSAASHLENALSRAGDSDEVAVALRYDLGEALLAAGREAEAREAFTKVAALDPKFRDVAERIARFG